jgi:hypothetical protein
MHVLLLGAGFSRNWNGWLATELLGELLGRLRPFPDLQIRLRQSGNFEELLGELQAAAQSGGDVAKLEAMQEAVKASFREMNLVFATLLSMNMSNDRAKSVAMFLSRFDAIFTLNQDLLLEFQYMPYGDPYRPAYFPGVTRPANWSSLQSNEKVDTAWTTSSTTLSLGSNAQPIFKLHGSANWSDASTGNLMVLGTRKHAEILGSPLLKAYFEEFKRNINHGKTRIMVVGYSFSDEHINTELTQASTHSGLEMYIVDPKGLELFAPPPNQAIGRTIRLQELNIVGVSTRAFSSAFKDDDLQFRSFDTFVKGA